MRIARLAPIVAVALVFAGSAGATTLSRQHTTERKLIQRINVVRAHHGLRTLRLARSLKHAAGRHTTSMAKAGYFQHELLASGTWWSFGTWIHWYWPDGSVRTWSAGENLAWAPKLGARKTVRRWMKSPPHRANLLNATWRRIGVAMMRVSGPVGVYRVGSAVTIATADFGRAS